MFEYRWQVNGTRCSASSSIPARGFDVADARPPGWSGARRRSRARGPLVQAPARGWLAPLGVVVLRHCVRSRSLSRAAGSRSKRWRSSVCRVPDPPFSFEALRSRGKVQRSRGTSDQARTRGAAREARRSGGRLPSVLPPPAWAFRRSSSRQFSLPSLIPLERCLPYVPLTPLRDLEDSAVGVSSTHGRSGNKRETRKP